MKQRAIFLDRDGTIIKEKHYLGDPAGIELISGVVEALHMLQQMGFKLVIITNQSGIKRGFFTAKDLEMVHRRLTEMLEQRGIAIDGVYYSADLPEEDSGTRKPSTALLELAARELCINTAGSYCIGDKREDIEMGKRKDLKTILVLTGYGREYEEVVEADHVARNLLDAARWIQQQEAV